MVLLVAVLSGVYANSPEITAKISPYSFQFVKTERKVNLYYVRTQSPSDSVDGH